VSFAHVSTKQLLQDFADLPLLIANLNPMPHKCAARL